MRRAILVLLLVTLPAAACGDDDDPAAPDDDQAAPPTVEVSAADLTFTPDEVTVPAGGEVTVTFENADDVPHTMTSEDLGLDIEADPGDSAEGTFTVPGSGAIEFHCEIHPNMTGQIVVEGSEPAPEGGGGQDEGEDTGYDY